MAARGRTHLRREPDADAGPDEALHDERWARQHLTTRVSVWACTPRAALRLGDTGLHHHDQCARSDTNDFVACAGFARCERADLLGAAVCAGPGAAVGIPANVATDGRRDARGQTIGGAATLAERPTLVSGLCKASVVAKAESVGRGLSGDGRFNRFDRTPGQGRCRLRVALGATSPSIFSARSFAGRGLVSRLRARW